MIKKDYLSEFPDELKEKIVQNIDSKRDEASLNQTNKEISQFFSQRKEKFQNLKRKIINHITDLINYAKGLEVDLLEIQKFNFNFRHYSLVKNSEKLQELFDALTAEQILKLFEIEPKLALIIAFNKQDFLLEALELLAKARVSEQDKKDLQNLLENLKPSIVTNFISGYTFIKISKLILLRDLTEVELLELDKIAETGFYYSFYHLNLSAKRTNLLNILVELNDFYTKEEFLENINNINDLINKRISSKTDSYESAYRASDDGNLYYTTFYYVYNKLLLLSVKDYSRLIDICIKEIKNSSHYEELINLAKKNFKEIEVLLDNHPVTGKNIFNVAIENYNSFAIEYLLDTKEFAGKVNLKQLVKAYNAEFSKCTTEKNKQELLKIKATVLKYAKTNNVKIDLNEKMLENVEEIKQEKVEESKQSQGFVRRMLNNANPKKCGCTIL